jgi:hypothetical protein
MITECSAAISFPCINPLELLSDPGTHSPLNKFMVGFHIWVLWVGPEPGLFLFVRFLFLFMCFGGARVGTQGFTLAKQELYLLSHTSSPFCSGYFGDGV